MISKILYISLTNDNAELTERSIKIFRFSPNQSLSIISIEL